MKPSINYTGSSMLMVRGAQHPAPRGQVLPFSWLSNRKPLKVGQRVMELPVETYCEGQAKGRFVRRPVSESTHPQAAFVFLTLFFFFPLPGYVAAEAKVYKFLTLRPTHCPSFRVFHDRSRPPGILFDGISGFSSKPCLLFSILDPKENDTLLIPSSESLHLLVLVP